MQHCWMLHGPSVCTPCYMMFRDIVESLKPVRLLTQQLAIFLLFRDFRSVAQQSWIRLHSSFNIVGGFHARSLRIASKVLWVVSLPRCTAGPNIVGSCYIRLYTTANTDATTPNNVGSCCAGLHVALFLKVI